MKRAIIFDLDGTLIDSCGVCVAILSDMIAERGLDHEIDLEEARSFMSRGGEHMVAALLGPASKNSAADLVEFRARYQEKITPAKALFDGVAAGLSELRDSGFTLAICSNKPQLLCEKALQDTGIRNMFSVVVGGSPRLAPKPAPDLLQAAIAQLNVAHTSCIYVGDSELDHAVATAADIPFYFVSYGYADRDWSPPVSQSFDCFTRMSRDLQRAWATVPID
jgi:phosphoglycolate phosphatase